MSTKRKAGEMQQRVVLVTGVAGGIGNATARIFQANQWKVVGVDRRDPDQPLPGVDRFMAVDISDEAQVKSLLDSVRDNEGRLDALVNNAAVQICKPLVEHTVEEWDRVMNTNTRSVFLAIKHAHPLLKASGHGAVVNVGSVHAVATSRHISAYAASKGALLALTRAAALEMAEDNIRVNTVLPGAVDTPMLHSGLSRGHVQVDSKTEDASEQVKALVRGLGDKHVMGRVGKPEEIAEAIRFLASEESSSFMTGQSIVVDGGATARLSTE